MPCRQPLSTISAKFDPMPSSQRRVTSACSKRISMLFAAAFARALSTGLCDVVHAGDLPAVLRPGRWSCRRCRNRCRAPSPASGASVTLDQVRQALRQRVAVPRGEAKAVEGSEQQLPRRHVRPSRGRPKPVLRLHVDDHALAVLAARELQVPVHGFGRQVALDHLHELLVGGRLDTADRAVDRDIPHGGFDAVDHQRELALRLDEPVLAGAGAGVHPRLTARAVLVPDRHRQRSTLVACAHRQRRDVWFGQKLFAFFL